ncbi:DUF1302 domain-containing protein [Pseudomonas matsuisoli]|uniref:DUF1302 domain-containing protein n=1 Tax=Pseudomonas matsuisoli TaxID=1515666 RepID=A0A917USL7_9PSED|nr:DUF1302 domain-containing protein [Pseudomonas matsuisoli]GGJ82899.1 hypothetical protein GCM10009304_06150 [Pseudomonas matsuisoli]
MGQGSRFGQAGRLGRSIYALLPLAIGAVSFMPQAHAVVFNIGAVEAQLDSSLTIESGWGTARPDQDLIGASNGGRGFTDTNDDGRLNFKQGEPFTKRFTGIHGLELRYLDSGLYVRGKYWYDFEQKDESRRFADIDDRGRQRLAQASGVALLDAYVYHNYQWRDQPGSVRLGKQVLNWGEGMFIGGGLNIVNPLDMSAYRRPGTPLKDGLLPVNLFHVAQNLSDNLAVEYFYQLEWDKSVQENCGTFFAQSDLLADGCDSNLRVLSSVDGGDGVVVPRAGSRNARDSGQWGGALHYYVAPLDMDIGAYVANYHSRSPVIGGRTAGAAAYAAGVEAVAADSRYYLDYPEDIRLYGLSFSKQMATGTTWRGELSYRPNAPVALNASDLMNAALVLSDRSLTPLDAEVASELKGYRRKETTQVQTGIEQILDNVMGAERLTVQGEVAWVHTGGLGGDARYGRDPVYGAGPAPSGGCQPGLTSGRYCEDEGFVTDNAWGYRLKAVWDYPDIVDRVLLKPNVAWSHDVKGFGPNGSFNEGAKAATIGLDASYQNTYRAALAYTNFFGGRYNTWADRDFLTLSVGIDF